jgi:rhodanese-related sulfurtransferase
MVNLTPAAVRNLYPLNQLSQDALAELSPAIRASWIRPGAQLFDFGESPDDYFYVLEGSVWLMDQKEETLQALEGASDAERIPLPYTLPSMHRACATREVKILSVDRRRLAETLARHAGGPAHASEMSHRAELASVGNDAWQAAMMRSPGFRRVPSGNMQRAFNLMHAMPVRRGDVIFQQGTPADDFYVVAEGRCEVLRSFAPDHPAIRIAECGVGDVFGDDSLVSDTPTTASVRMLTDGCLMRLYGDDFRFLIKRSLHRPINMRQASDLIARGGRWFDVRLPSERMEMTLPNAVMTPHTLARSMPFKGRASHPYVVACSNGFDAPAIAFTLCKNGYDAYCLKGGLASLSAHAFEDIGRSSQEWTTKEWPTPVSSAAFGLERIGRVSH